MSDTQNSELDLELAFLPSWAKQSTDTNRFANHPGASDRELRGGDRRGGGGFGERRPRPQGTGGPGGGRPGGFGGPRTGGGARPGGGGRPEGRGGPRRDGPGGERRDFRGDRGPRPELAPLPKVNVELLPDQAGVESLARQIKLTGRAYPLFEIAGLVMKKPERYVMHFSTVRNAAGQPEQPLLVCSLDDTLWLAEDEAVRHMLEKHFGTFYQAEKTPCDPPKGTYTLVAQCGLTGAILGPPNYHDYQGKLARLHTEKFGRMPFEMFKSRVKMVRDEAVVKKWIEEQSFKIEYSALNVPEPLKLATMADVENHFRATHLPNLLRAVEHHTLPGNVALQLRSPGLRTLARRAVDDQMHHPLRLATVLSQRFASLGLQFFKVNKQFTHVSVARPTHLDLDSTPVSDGVARIIGHLNAHPKCTRKQLIAALAPSPEPAAPVPGGAPAPAGPPAPAPELTPEQSALASDLHWLIHQGHVIEFATGQIETAKKPLPRPEKVEKPERTPRDRAHYLPVFLALPPLPG